MRLFRASLLFLLAASLCAHAFVTAAAQQQTADPKTTQQDEVVRVDAELVQTDVTVFDKQGKFVDGLKAEQFELKVDGKPTPVSFFERVTAGSAREEALTASRVGAPAPRTRAGAAPRGRVIVFFIDDMHLSPDSVQRTRKLISQFVDTEMAPDDMVAVASATGQIGFLQQFTDNKAVVRAALARLVYKPFTVRDAETVPMTEYQALRIDQGDSDALDYFSTQLLSETSWKIPNGGTLGPPPGGGPVNAKLPPGQRSGGLTPESAKRMVRERAKHLLRQSSNVTLNMFGSLEGLMRSSAQLPGRKLVFFVSDGFYINDRNTGFSDKLRQITDAALRAGVVIYSLDARGLVSSTDASSNRADMLGRLARANTGEVAASQDGLNLLAADTGGRAVFNTANLERFMSDALEETSNYYLLAWRPETAEQKSGTFKRIEVSIAGRPDLTVRLPRGYLDALAAQTAAAAKAASPVKPEEGKSAKSEATEIQAALTAFAPQRALPTRLSVSFLDVPEKGPVLTASTQVSTDALSYGADGAQAAAVDLAGVVLNTEGKTVSSFKTRLNIKPLPPERAAEAGAGVVYSHRAPLPAGIYQVRVAARDEGGKRVGSAHGWIEIPDLKASKLTMSSILLNEQSAAAATTTPVKGGEAPPVQFSVDRRFRRDARLGFMLFIYNAARNGTAAPDLAAQVQVFRGEQAVVNTPARPLVLTGLPDLARIPYFGSFPLRTFSPGRYVLQITVTDKTANTNTSERVGFVVE